MDNIATARCRFAGHESEIRRIRAFVRQVLTSHPACETAELLTGELATNAIRHTKSGSPGGTLLVRLRFDTEYVRAEIRDEGAPGIPQLLPQAIGEESGRGLLLVHELADFWGFETAQATTSVWFGCGAGGDGDVL